MDGLRSGMDGRVKAGQARGGAGRLDGTGRPGGDDLRRGAGRHGQEAEYPDGEP